MCRKNVKQVANEGTAGASPGADKPKRGRPRTQAAPPTPTGRKGRKATKASTSTTATAALADEPVGADVAAAVAGEISPSGAAAAAPKKVRKKKAAASVVVKSSGVALEDAGDGDDDATGAAAGKKPARGRKVQGGPRASSTGRVVASASIAAAATAGGALPPALQRLAEQLAETCPGLEVPWEDPAAVLDMLGGLQQQQGQQQGQGEGKQTVGQKEGEEMVLDQWLKQQQVEQQALKQQQQQQAQQQGRGMHWQQPTQGGWRNRGQNIDTWQEGRGQFASREFEADTGDRWINAKELQLLEMGSRGTQEKQQQQLERQRKDEVDRSQVVDLCFDGADVVKPSQLPNEKQHAEEQQEQGVGGPSHLLGSPQQLHTPVSAMKRASLTGPAGALAMDGLDYWGQGTDAQGGGGGVSECVEGMDLCSPSPAPLAMRLAAAAAAQGRKGGGGCGGKGNSRNQLSGVLVKAAAVGEKPGNAGLDALVTEGRAKAKGCNSRSPPQQNQWQEQLVFDGEEQQGGRAGVKRTRKPQARGADADGSVCLISSSSSGHAGGGDSSGVEEEVGLPAVRSRFNGTTPLAMARSVGGPEAVHVLPGATLGASAEEVCAWDLEGLGAAAAAESDVEDEGQGASGGKPGSYAWQHKGLGGSAPCDGDLGSYGRGSQVSKQVLATRGTRVEEECIELD